MARKPPDWRQPSLFPLDAGSSPGQAPATGLSSAKAEDAGQAPDNPPEPQDPSTLSTEGEHYAIQDLSPRTFEGTDAAARAATHGAQAPADDGALRQGVEDQPRSLETAALADAAGQRPEPDRERSPGNSPQGAGGSFALRVSSERQR